MPRPKANIHIVDEPRVFLVKSNSGLYSARRAADEMLGQLRASRENEHLVPTFIAAVCAGIEGTINDAYVDYLFAKLGRKYRKYVRPFLMWPIEVRLRNLPVLISDGRYILNENSKEVRALLGLFQIRNRMLHVVHHWEELEKVNEPYYASETVERLTLGELRRHRSLLSSVFTGLGDLWNRMRRKNFNPGPWFLVNKKEAG